MELFKSKILIVGGAGFVGSNLTHLILEEHDPSLVYIVDNLLSSDISNVPKDKRVHFAYGSITNEKILKQLPEDFDFVFHLACFHGNQSSIEDPMMDHENNTLTTLKLFERIKDFKQLKKVVYASAGCAVAEKTFDEAKATPENAPISLFHDSPYSISKIIGELYGNYYFSRYNLPFVKARFQNVYGPREILGAGNWRGTQHTVWRNVVPTFVWKSLHGEALPLDNGGNASRDFIYVEDMAKGLIACAQHGEAGEVYNLASGRETSIKILAETINRLSGNTTPMDIRPPRDWDRSGKRFGSTLKSEEKIGFKASIPIEEGLKKTIDWTIAHKSLIQQSIEKHRLLLNQLS